MQIRNEHENHNSWRAKAEVVREVAGGGGCFRLFMARSEGGCAVSEIRNLTSSAGKFLFILQLTLLHVRGPRLIPC